MEKHNYTHGQNIVMLTILLIQPAFTSSALRRTTPIQIAAKRAGDKNTYNDAANATENGEDSKYKIHNVSNPILAATLLLCFD